MTFQDFLRALGYDPRPYSGRGMYAVDCWAIDVTPAIFAAAILDYEQDTRLDPETRAMAIRALRSCREGFDGPRFHSLLPDREGVPVTFHDPDPYYAASPLRTRYAAAVAEQRAAEAARKAAEVAFRSAEERCTHASEAVRSAYAALPADERAAMEWVDRLFPDESDAESVL